MIDNAQALAMDDADLRCAGNASADLTLIYSWCPRSNAHTHPEGTHWWLRLDFRPEISDELDVEVSPSYGPDYAQRGCRASSGAYEVNCDCDSDWTRGGVSSL